MQKFNCADKDCLTCEMMYCEQKRIAEQDLNANYKQYFDEKYGKGNFSHK